MLSRIALSLCVLAALGGTARAQEAEQRPPFTMVAVDTNAMITTRSGLKYRDLITGTGAAVVQGRFVSVHYIGVLTDGREFDASRPGQMAPIRFQVGVRRVIAGWDEGLLGMRVGGRRQLVIPPNLGYGPRGMGPIPANATLVFLIEVVDIN